MKGVKHLGNKIILRLELLVGFMFCEIQRKALLTFIGYFDHRKYEFVNETIIFYLGYVNSGSTII